MTAATEIAQARDQVENAAWLNALARVGLVAKGVSYALVGVLAIKLAADSGGKATSRQGALHTLAQHSFGKFVLVVLAFGFAAYAIWRFAQAFFDKNNDGDGAKGLAKRAGYFGRGAIYAGLTYSTIKILSGSAEQSQNQKAHKTAATALSWPAGKWIVGAAGLVLIGVGLWNGYRALEKKFLKNWKTGKMGPTAQRWGTRSGVVGLSCADGGVRPDRELRRQGRLRLQPTGSDRPRRRAAEAREPELRLVAARNRRRRTARLRRLLLLRGALPRGLTQRSR